MCRDRQLEAGSTECPSEKTTAWVRYPHRWVTAPLQREHRACWVLRDRAPVLVCIVWGVSWIRGHTGSEIVAQTKHS